MNCPGGSFHFTGHTSKTADGFPRTVSAMVNWNVAIEPFEAVAGLVLSDPCATSDWDRQLETLTGPRVEVSVPLDGVATGRLRLVTYFTNATNLRGTALRSGQPGGGRK